jgi:outer membrane protein OmpA-like peptidoglycan-associated protein
MNCKKTVCWVGLATAFSMLAACGSNEPKPEGMEQDKASATAKTTAQTAPVTPPLPAASVKNPTLIAFDKMAVTLDDKDKVEVAQTLERAKQAKRIVITGYCDRHQVGNPGEAAIARAVVTRDELIRLGIAPAIIQVKYVTKVNNKHAAEIKFD